MVQFIQCSVFFVIWCRVDVIYIKGYLDLEIEFIVRLMVVLVRVIIVLRLIGIFYFLYQVLFGKLFFQLRCFVDILLFFVGVVELSFFFFLFRRFLCLSCWNFKFLKCLFLIFNRSVFYGEDGMKRKYIERLQFFQCEGKLFKRIYVNIDVGLVLWGLE